MAKVQIIDVEVLDNPSNFFNPFQFQITFDCMENLRDDLEWKIIYVGSAESEACDQILDSVLVGPIPAGRHKFVFQADPPKPELIPVQDAVGVTVVIITCTYHGHEFVRVGYYVNNEYAEPELRETPPDKPDFNKLTRNILSSAPRVTRFKINWDDSASTSTAEGGQTYETLEENIPPSPEDVQHTMAENSKDSICANRDSNGPLSSSVLNSENIRNTCEPSTSKPVPACFENSIDAMEAQMLLD